MRFIFANEPKTIAIQVSAICSRRRLDKYLEHLFTLHRSNPGDFERNSIPRLSTDQLDKLSILTQLHMVWALTFKFANFTPLILVCVSTRPTIP